MNKPHFIREMTPPNASDSISSSDQAKMAVEYWKLWVPIIIGILTSVFLTPYLTTRAISREILTKGKVEAFNRMSQSAMAFLDNRERLTDAYYERNLHTTLMLLCKPPELTTQSGGFEDVVKEKNELIPKLEENERKFAAALQSDMIQASAYFPRSSSFAALEEELSQTYYNYEYVTVAPDFMELSAPYMNGTPKDIAAQNLLKNFRNAMREQYIKPKTTFGNVQALLKALQNQPPWNG